MRQIIINTPNKDWAEHFLSWLKYKLDNFQNETGQLCDYKINKKRFIIDINSENNRGLTTASIPRSATQIFNHREPVFVDEINSNFYGRNLVDQLGVTSYTTSPNTGLTDSDMVSIFPVSRPFNPNEQIQVNNPILPS